MIPHRLVEACALLPLLHVPADGPTSVFVVGPAAEIFAADTLRWPDVRVVHTLEPLPRLRDQRVSVGRPQAGSCDAVLCSPDLPCEAFAFAVAQHGVISASVSKPEEAGAFYTKLRGVFPRRMVPWREYTPEPLFGAICSPGGKPERLRKPPAAARRLSPQYLPCLFTFGPDELPLVFGQTPRSA